MRQSDILGALVRRWYLIPLGIALTVGLCFGAVWAVPVSYEVRASLLVLPPRISATGGNSGNPFLGLAGLGPAASVLGRAMTASGTERALKDRGATGTYEVDPDLSTSGPLLLVVAQASTPRGALNTMQMVLDEAPRTLAELQRSIGAPAGTLLTTSVINKDSKPKEVRKSQLRAVILASIAGLTGTVFGVVLLDGLLSRLSERVRVRKRGRDRGARPVAE